MKAAHGAVRTCFACRKSAEKAELLRLVVDDDGQIWPDFSAKLPGRGVYLCMSVSCLQGLSDKRLGVLNRDFSPQLPQWQSLQTRLSDMLAARLNQLLAGMKRRSAIGRDAVMHSMWKKERLLVVFASDAGEALVRQVQDAVGKRDEMKLRSQVLVSTLTADLLGLALAREKISVVAFSWDNPVEKFQQYSVWQEALTAVGVLSNKKESKVTNGE